MDPGIATVFRVYCCATDPRTLRPQAASYSDEYSIINAIQRGLLYRDGGGHLVPSLATDLPTVSADLLTYTYHLRTDAQYSDGTSILAGDIVRAVRDLADPRNAFDMGYLMCYLKGGYELMGVNLGCPEGETPWLDRGAGTFDDATVEGLLDQLGVTAPDDHTVVFQLVQPTVFWPDITAMPQLTPVPPHQASTAGGDPYWYEAGFAASGPFVLSEWTHNSKVVLTPNPNWYGKTPGLERIEIGIGGGPDEAVASWESGNLDEVAVYSAAIPRVLANPDYASMIVRTNRLSVEYWDFANCVQPEAWPQSQPCPVNEAVTSGMVGRSPLQNVHFRRAMTQAIDKTDMINQAFAGIGVPAYSPTMPGIPGFPTVTAIDTPLPFDPAAARTELSTALGELGVAEPDAADIKPASDDCDATCQETKAWAQMLGTMRFNYNCDAGHDGRVMYLAEQWRQVLGFTNRQLDTRCVDNGLWPGPFPPKTTWADVARDAWGADFPHPDNQNRPLFACGARYNGSNYCNPAYDGLLDEGAKAAIYQESLPFYHQAEQLLVQDAPVLFLRYGETVSLVRPWVVNYVATPSDHQNVGDTLYENIQILAH